MPNVHQIGKRHFAHTMKYPSRKFPIIDRGNTAEIEAPYRYGQSLVVRMPLSSKAVVVGRWTGVSADEDAALRHAIGWRELDATS